MKALIFLCKKKELVRDKKGYLDAFQNLGIKTYYTGKISSINKFISDKAIDIDTLIGIIRIDTPSKVLPLDILDIDIPTINFDFDTYLFTKKRALAARLFDFQIVCHPNYEQIFRGYNCSYPILLPWCTDTISTKSSFPTPSNINTEYDIAWVGRLDGSFYSYRRKIIKILQNRYHLNDVDKFYNWEEMNLLYKKSKIVVNISRDDYLQDANMRCFEAMGAGALLFTKLPTELSYLGFKQGKHFVGYENESDLIKKIDYYLFHENERNNISKNGERLVLSKHTYSNRAQLITNLLSDEGDKAIKFNKFRTCKKNALVQQLLTVSWRDDKLIAMFDIMFFFHKLPSLLNTCRMVHLFIKKIYLFVRK